MKKRVKYKKSIALLTVVFTLTLVMIATVEARPLRSTTMLTLNIEPEEGDHAWSGAFEGLGTIYFYADGEVLEAGITTHHPERWEIVDADDDILMSGTDTTLVNWVNMKFMAHGVVTEAYGEWAHLVGHTFHARGIINDGVWPYTALAEIRIN